MERQDEQLPIMNPARGPLLLQSISLEIPLPQGGAVVTATIPEAARFARLRRRSKSYWEASGAKCISYGEAKARRHDAEHGHIDVARVHDEECDHVEISDAHNLENLKATKCGYPQSADKIQQQNMNLDGIPQDIC